MDDSVISLPLEAIGWSGVIFACDVQMKVPIARVSTLFTERRYLAVQGKYDNLIFGLLYFPIVKFHAKWPLKPAI